MLSDLSKVFSVGSAVLGLHTSVLLCGQAAVYNKARACHEPGVVRSEKNDTLRDVAGYTQPANRMGGQRELSRRIDVVRAEIAARLTKVCSPISV